MQLHGSGEGFAGKFTESYVRAVKKAALGSHCTTIQGVVKQVSV